MMAILTALLVPAVGRAKERARTAACLNNLRQLGVAAQLYAADHDGLLVANLNQDMGTNLWVNGNMQNSVDATNTSLLQSGTLFPYVKESGAFRCPADVGKDEGVAAQVRVRSYAMNSWTGSRYMENYPRPTGFRTFVKDSEFAPTGPAGVWYLADEDRATLDDGWFLVTMDDSAPFASSPATRHQGGYALDFADGHAATIKVVQPANPNAEPAGANARNSDWIQLKQMTTAR
jgi:general secretion pathway protein G